MAFRDVSIKGKLITIMLGTAGSVLLVSLLLLLLLNIGTAREEARLRLQSLAAILAANSDAALAFNDPVAAREVLDSLSSQEDVLWAQLRDAAGRPFVEYTRADRRTREPGQPVGALGWGMVQVEQPILVDGDTIGGIQLRADLRKVRQSLIQQSFAVLGVFLLALLLALRISATLHRVISEPVARLLETMRQVARDRNLRRRAERYGSDELGDLVDGFNAMLDRLQAYDRDLAHYSAHLEAMVEQRTRQLDQARQAAEATSQAKSGFLATMSHELRTPLNAILGYAQVLQGDPRLEQGLRDDVRMIQRGGEHLLYLINEVLDLAKIEAGRMTLELAPVNLPGLLREVLALLRVRLPPGLTLDAELGQLPDCILADRGRLRQVLLNLIGNAVKFTAQGRVQFRIWREEGPEGQARLGFALRDQGPGIPADHIQRVLRPFEQVGGGLNPGEGTGLGLSISASLVRLMGGQLCLGSKTANGPWASNGDQPPPLAMEGPGTLVWFSLDFPLADGGQAVIEEGFQPYVAGTAPEVLVVDDLADNRQVLVRMLGLLGIRPWEADGGAAALAQIRERCPDLLITDLRMPGMSGYVLIRRIREQPALADLPIIALSASVNEGTRERSLAAGGNAFLAKPLRQEELFALLGTLLGRPGQLVAESPDNKAPEPPPEGAVIAELRQLVDAGNLPRLRQLCDQLQTRHPRFARQVLGYVNDLRLEDLGQFLQPLEG